MRVLALCFISLLATGCGFDTRSDQFACDSNADCETGRTCNDGFCVVGGGDCDPACDACNEGVCIMRCLEQGSCGSRVVCPPSETCRVNCNGMNSCRSGVDCSQATDCEVNCAAAGACGGNVRCGEGRCTVECTARDTCAGGVDCADACACDTDCTDFGGNTTCVPECPGNGNECSNGTDCVSARCPGQC